LLRGFSSFFNVLDTAKEDLAHLYQQERAAFPAQVKQAKEWSQAAEERAVAEIKQLKSEGKDWLNRHPGEKKRLEQLEREMHQWTDRGKQGFDHFVHPEVRPRSFLLHTTAGSLNP